jgi:hypothetical protein
MSRHRTRSLLAPFALAVAILLQAGGSASAHHPGPGQPEPAFEKGPIPGYGMTKSRTAEGLYRMRIGERVVEFDEHTEADRAMADSTWFDLSSLPAAPPRCASTGRRLIAVYGYPANATNALAGQIAGIRETIGKVNGKLFAESLLSSAGQRTANLKFQCDASGQVAVAAVPIPRECSADGDPGYDPSNGACYPNDAGHVAWAVEQQLGLPQGSNAVKYVIFYDKTWAGYSGVAFNYYSDDVKDPATNPNRTETTSAVLSREIWDRLTVLHEIGHLMGAVQLSAPNSSGAYHCNDGIDVMCYFDGPYSRYNERACATGTSNVLGDLFNTALGMPFDCGYDDFFRTVSGNAYLDSHWNTGGAENDLLEYTPRWPGGAPADPADPGDPGEPAGSPDLELFRSRTASRPSKTSIRRIALEIRNRGAGPTRGPTSAVVEISGRARLKSVRADGWDCSRGRLSSLCTLDDPIAPDGTETIRVAVQAPHARSAEFDAGVFTADDPSVENNTVTGRLGPR